MPEARTPANPLGRGTLDIIVAAVLQCLCPTELIDVVDSRENATPAFVQYSELLCELPLGN